MTDLFIVYQVPNVEIAVLLAGPGLSVGARRTPDLSKTIVVRSTGMVRRTAAQQLHIEAASGWRAWRAILAVWPRLVLSAIPDTASLCSRTSLVIRRF
jgi:hypothetical protein